MPLGVAATIANLKPLLVGQDPRAFEARFRDMIRGTRSSPGGLAAKAIAGVESALVDIKAKALGISVVELFGGPTREQVRLYWSHCGTTRVRHAGMLGLPPIENWKDITALGKEVAARGFTALKTNIVLPCKGVTCTRFDGSRARITICAELAGPAYRDADRTFRDAVAPT